MNAEENNRTLDQIVNDALVEHQDKLYALIRMMMVNCNQDASDVLQRTNQTVLLHYDKYDPSRPVWPWLRGVAIHQVQLYFRAKKSDRLDYDTDLVEELASDVEENSLFRDGQLDEYIRALRHCMGKLPPLKRELLEERYVKREKASEVARSHSLSVESFSAMLYYLRKVLQNCIEKHLALWRNPKKRKEQETEDSFARGLDRFLDHEMTESEQKELIRQLASDKDARQVYIQQAFMHAVMECRTQEVFSPEGVRGKPVFRVLARVAGIAAALAALWGGGAALWKTRQTTETGERRELAAAGGFRPQSSAIVRSQLHPNVWEGKMT